MALDWNHLEYFRVVGRHQHVTRAAEELGMSQPALSRALARFESDLGVPLLERAGRSVRLTRFGEAFLKRIEKAHAEIDEGRRELADLADAKRGAIELGFFRTLGAAYIPQFVRRFSAAYPQVRLSFTQNNSGALQALLEDGRLDLIFTTAPLENAAFSWAHVADQDMALIVPAGHRLAKRKTVALREVAGEPFVSFKPGHAFRAFTDALCAAAGFAPKISFEGDDSSSLPGFVAAGFGVAIVPPESAAFDGVTSLKISEPTARRAIGIAWMKERYLSASARAFRDFAVSESAKR
ncbi:MAG TPA: LysR family transcriptional regulator [Alphaproteobacteria bacterium]|nr:LysR family transcriptional regulator [Alphaproteobacteria bacterium]